MAGKEAFEKKLEALAALRAAPREHAVEPLRKALKDRSNYVVSKAAAIAGEMAIAELIPDLARAFDRFMTDPVKTDPQCWAKNAIVKALKDLNHDDPAVFLRGIEHVQMEPVWSIPPVADTAIALRGACALALVACSLDRQSILTHLVDLMADEEPHARIDAIRALGQCPGFDTVLILRLKTRLPEKEAAVTGQCFDTLLDIAPEDSIDFVSGFLEAKNPDLQSEAVGALASSRQPAAAARLMGVIEEGRPELAVLAVVALAHSRFREEFRERIGAAVGRRDIAALSEAYRKEFPPLES